METTPTKFTAADALKSCEDARNISINKMNNETQIPTESCFQGKKCQDSVECESRTFAAGKVVKLAGFPVECTTEVTIKAHPNTWILIDEWEAKLHEGGVLCGSHLGSRP